MSYLIYVTQSGLERAEKATVHKNCYFDRALLKRQLKGHKITFNLV